MSVSIDIENRIHQQEGLTIHFTIPAAFPATSVGPRYPCSWVRPGLLASSKRNVVCLSKLYCYTFDKLVWPQNEQELDREHQPYKFVEADGMDSLGRHIGLRSSKRRHSKESCR